MEYKVLDKIALKYGLTRSRDFVVGEVNGYMISVIKDKSGLNEVNIVTGKMDKEKSSKINSLIGSLKKELSIYKYRIKGENISLVLTKILDENKEYETIINTLEVLTKELSKFVEKPNTKSMRKKADEEAFKKENDNDENKEITYKKILKRITENVIFKRFISTFIIIMLWYINKNTYYFNLIIPFITPFILGYIFKDAIKKKSLISYSIFFSLLGVYGGTIVRVMEHYFEALENPFLDALYNVNRSIIQGDTLSGRTSVLLPLIVGLITSVIGSILVEKFKEKKTLFWKEKEDLHK